MTLAVHVNPRKREGPHCAYCRQADEVMGSCAGCGAAIHPECRWESGRCTTIGCASPPLVVASELTLSPDQQADGVVNCLAVFCVLLLAASVVGLFVAVAVEVALLVAKARGG